MGNGVLRPKNGILGADVAGLVEAVGPGVSRFRPGDAVFGEISQGGFAEYACAAEDVLVSKPESVTFEEAAAVPVAALTALQGLRDGGRVQAGQKVLINGASGGVGTFAVQFAKLFGAEVTGVCSGGKMDLVRSLGADHVVDYSRDDYARTGQIYDVIFDIALLRSASHARRALRPGGIHVVVGGSGARLVQAMLLKSWRVGAGGRKIAIVMANPNQQDLTALQKLLEDGEIKPVIDRTYGLNEIDTAIRYVEEGHARGKVVITL